MSRKLWPMAMGWWVYGVSGVIALKYLNVPMFSSFRRFTTIIVMYGEFRLYGTRAFPFHLFFFLAFRRFTTIIFIHGQFRLYGTPFRTPCRCTYRY
jgi:hypothetical protein